MEEKSIKRKLEEINEETPDRIERTVRNMVSQSEWETYISVEKILVEIRKELIPNINKNLTKYFDTNDLVSKAIVDRVSQEDLEVYNKVKRIYENVAKRFSDLASQEMFSVICKFQ